MTTPSAGATPPATATLTVLVTNDDGVHAPGIDAIVQALGKEPGLTVRVVAPAANQSGTGGKTTPGTVKYNIAATLSGYPAIAVAGTPSDAANVAITQLQIKPNLMISGINALQNLGPIVDVSARSELPGSVPATECLRWR